MLNLTYQNQNNFGLLNLNIASLNQHIVNLSNFIGLLKFAFPIIALNEHKIGPCTPINNISLPNFSSCYYQTKSPHNRGFLF